MLSYHSLYFDNPPQSGRALDIWIPHRGPIRPLTCFFVHGGGWRHGRRDQMHPLMHAFYEEGYVCVSVDYRLGEATVPTQLADVREGLALADASLRDKGIAQPFVLYGSSAGGHLALLAGLAPQGVCGDLFKGPTPPVAGIIGSCAPITFMPWDEIFPGIWQCMQQAAGKPFEESPELYRQLSPDQYATTDSPPILFLLAECEHMMSNEKTIHFARSLESQGGSAAYRIYPLAEHGFFYALQRKSQQLAFRDVLTFLDGLAHPQP